MEASLGQFCINVSDLDRAVEFWEGVIGIPVSSRTEIPNVKEVVLQADVGGSRHPACPAPRPHRPDRHG